MNNNIVKIKSASVENACADARVVFVPYFSKEVIESICSFIRGASANDLVATEAARAASVMIERDAMVRTALVNLVRRLDSCEGHDPLTALSIEMARPAIAACEGE